jgi:hypothetical protein
MLALATRPGEGFLLANEPAAKSPAIPPITAGRVRGEVAAALGAALMGGVVTAYASVGFSWTCQSDECAVGVVAGAFAAYSTIIAVAVKWAGSAGDQHVPLSHPLLGALAGGTVGWATFMYAENRPNGGVGPFVLALALPPAGAVIGAIAGREWDAEPAGSLRVLPASTPPSAWTDSVAPGPIPGTRLTVASVDF